MNIAKSLCLGVMLLAVAGRPSQLAGQQTQYKLIDLGTLDGPNALNSANGFQDRIISNAGVVSFYAETPAADPLSPNCYIFPDCLVAHAVRWENGILTDLGALPGNGNSSAAGGINARGWIPGQSENGQIDPVTGLPETRATLWKAEQIIDLGTFGGNWSLATTMNDVGQVIGFATNSAPDPFSMFFGGTQTRAFLWQNGVLQDLGTLGGPDAEAFSINNRGQVAGFSYTNTTPNATTGIPTVHPFLWENGKMTDLGTLGGTYAGTGSCSFAIIPCNSLSYEGNFIINNQAQVIGTSNLPGDQTFHSFLWQQGTLTDLGTLGGDNSAAYWVNEVGEVVGVADLPGSQAHDGFLWKNGVLTDLGNFGLSSVAFDINSKGQIVGHSRLVDGTPLAYLWENGGPMIDLNSLISPTDLLLTDAYDINDRGEIVAQAILPNGDAHIVLLIPCSHGTQGCPNAAAGPQSNHPAVSQDWTSLLQRRAIVNERPHPWRARLAQQHPF